MKKVLALLLALCMIFALAGEGNITVWVGESAVEKTKKHMAD